MNFIEREKAKKDTGIDCFAEVTINPKNNQQALRATCFLKKDDVLCSFQKSVLVDQISYLTLQSSTQSHIKLKPEFLEKINHSCTPNVYFDTVARNLIALKDIRIGEELCFFYPSTEWKMIQPFDCNCGQKKCLKQIEGAQSLSATQLFEYRLSPHIRELKHFCPCGSNALYATCCLPILEGKIAANSAEGLMRSRYTAYVKANISYLVETTDVSTRHLYMPKDIEKWAKESNWLQLDIIHASQEEVVFKAWYLDKNNKLQNHFERSTFSFTNGKWYYVNGGYEE